MTDVNSKTVVSQYKLIRTTTTTHIGYKIRFIVNNVIICQQNLAILKNTTGKIEKTVIVHFQLLPTEPHYQ